VALSADIYLSQVYYFNRRTNDSVWSLASILRPQTIGKQRPQSASAGFLGEYVEVKQEDQAITASSPTMNEERVDQPLVKQEDQDTGPRVVICPVGPTGHITTLKVNGLTYRTIEVEVDSRVSGFAHCSTLRRLLLHSDVWLYYGPESEEK
jgi:hypothetical protein